jgi:hypothetical protein
MTAKATHRDASSCAANSGNIGAPWRVQVPSHRKNAGPLPERVWPGMTTCMNLRSWVSTRGCVLWTMLWLAFPSAVLAGPIEVFNGVDVASGNPDRLTARWTFGDSGFFVSEDRGASFRMSCFPAVNSTLMGRSVQALKTATDGSMCVGTVNQVFCSNTKGCDWKEAPEMAGQWVSDFAEDPIDKQVLYLATGTAEGDNGIYVRETPTSAWKPLGKQLPAWFSRVHVVKNGTGKRIYVSSQENVFMDGADGGPPVQQVKYFVRYSDDNAATWTSNYYGVIPERTNLRLVAIDPTNSDRIVVLLVRTGELLTDDLYYSDKRGEPGSYVKIGTVTEFSGATFTPEGVLYYGDNDQMTPGLYKVAKLGEPPSKISGSTKIGCVNYDPASERLYICADWRFGTADVSTGEFTMLFNIMNASEFIECGDEAPLNVSCGPALRSPNFCDITHYPAAPVCVEYFGTGGAGSAAAGGSGGMSGGSAGTPSAGAGGSAGSSGAGAVSGGGAGSAGGGAGSGPQRKKGSGCSVRAVGSSEGAAGWLGLGFAFGLAGWSRVRRRWRAPG